MKLKNFQSFALGAIVVSFTAYGAIAGFGPGRNSANSVSLVKTEPVAATEVTGQGAPAPSIKLNATATTPSIPKNMAELTSRDYVLFWIPTRANTYQQGGSVKFFQIGNTDSIHINWFYYDQGLNAKVDFEKGEIRVPAQYIKTITENGAEHDVWWCVRVGGKFSAEPSDEVIYKFNEDGALIANTGFGFMWKDKTGTGYTWCYDPGSSQMLPANGTMTTTKEIVENGVVQPELAKYEYGIYATQDGNILNVLNFADNGNSAIFVLYPDSTVYIPKQIQEKTTNIDYYLASNVTANGDNNLKWDYSGYAKSAKANGLTLGPWSLIGYHKTTGGLYWNGLHPEATLTFDFDLDWKATKFKGTGTVTDPFQIANADDLNTFIDFANKGLASSFFFKQTADINLGNTPLTVPVITSEFDGSYDGAGHTLSGLNLSADAAKTEYSGIFAKIGEDGVIKNLTLEGEAAFASKYCGPLVGSLYGTLENVTSKMTVSTTATYYGGIAGYTFPSAVIKNSVFAGVIELSGGYAGGITSYSAMSTFENCGFTGKITNATASTKAVNNVGGLVGYAYPSKFIKCYSQGEFSADSLSTYRGGILGYGYAQTTETGYHGEFEFKGCVNESNIKGKQNIGGIIGYIVPPACITATNYKFRSSVLVDSCVNKGEIYLTKTASYAGGIIGQSGNPIVVQNCENYGTIKGFSGYYMGGITGGSATTAANDSINSVITKCRNFGSITDLDCTDANATYSAGGIIGYNNNYHKVVDCQNYADITVAYNGGGIVGAFSGTGGKVIGCTNYGDVKIQSHVAGGIVGNGSSYSQTITGCVNFGEVVTEAVKPGTSTSFTNRNGVKIGGIIGNGYGMLSDNLNTAPVTGASLVGGIVGATNKGTTSNFGTKVFRNLNTGKVKCRYELESGMVEGTDSVGAICGSSFANTTCWLEGTNAQDSNYYTPNVVADLGTLTEEYIAQHMGKSISEADLINSDKLGKEWSCYDKYCWPVPTAANAGDAVKVWAAQVVAGEKDVLPRITDDFFVGAPKGLVWTSTSTALTFNGTNAVWGTEAVAGEVKLTATCGDFSKEIVLQVDKASSVEELNTEAGEVATEIWLDTAGRRIAKPAVKDGQVYILIRAYKNGTSKTIKVFN